MKFNLEKENINYIKINYSDKEDVKHWLKASVKNVTEREVEICVKSDEKLFIPSPQEIAISFACENGLYEAKTTLKYTNYQEPYLYINLKTPEEIFFKQEREYFRVHLEENVILNLNSTAITTKTYDISANGIRVILDKDIEFENIIKIGILFQSNEIFSDAKFVRFDEEDGILKASFQFVNMDEHVRDIISQKCIQRQLELKRNSLKN